MNRQIMSNDLVRLRDDLPALLLRRGDRGIVRSAWFYPHIAFEVEFRDAAPGCPERVLLLEDQVQIANESAECN